MGRLFWKLFLAIFLAQLLTGWGVGFLFWLEHAARQNQSPNMASVPGSARPEGPPPAFAPGGPQPRPPGASTNTQEFQRPFPPGPRPGGPRGLPWQPAVIGLIASLLFAALLARHLSRPIVGLSKAFKDVAGGNFDIRLARNKLHWQDELSDLGEEFDRTAAQLKMLVHNQRRLLHDVSHEVRSPLARMQLAIDLARQQPDKTPESMARLEREAGRIDHLVEELLTLSRLEAGACGQLDDTVDLPELLGELVEDARFEAEAKKCHVALGGDAQGLVKGRADLLHRAIENVLRNAIRYTTPASALSVGVENHGEELCVTVEDCGPGVPQSALETIFDPFVRLGDARSNDGYGLGLAITRQIIEAHGGRVIASNREQGGLRVEMYLPISQANTASA
ncbi:ATP-binding protein [Uliginosibacterium sp. TH139]|uniref:HAMP domain-containing sensor histidine kinase n=1 Tax=Uliginosibacterium sp. TH139 TaxID=2067453 RepID=UPI000C7AF592|nr:ATP-binding protein [Uliginosibacterium sp. TH139]PLK48619.1 two-component sensor histidine kinase [Uliginosibacterium sp. TH139]